MQHHFYKRENELTYCEICGGAEAYWTKECPEKKMRPEIEEAVQSGEIDYYDGSWWWIDCHIDNRYALTEKEALLQIHYDSCSKCDLAGPPDYCPIYRKIREEV